MIFHARLIIACTALLGLTITACQTDPLAVLHDEIVADYPALDHVKAEAVLQRLQNAPGRTLIWDSRPVPEYAVSHIPTAVQIEPDARAEDLLTRFDVSGKDIVIYCSVGRRSSIVGERTRAELLAAGARSVANLEGGIFAWHNSGRALVNASGPTQAVHPYDEFWGRLIKNRDAARYTP